MVALVILGASLASLGCVSKGLLRDTKEQIDARLDSTESGVEANERRIQDMARETDGKIAAVESSAKSAMDSSRSAMTKATEASEAADKAARGKLLWSVKLSDDMVRFSFDGTQVPSEAASALQRLIQEIKSYGKALYLEVEGHTDNVGSESYNLALGQKRADAVRDYLRKEGGIPLHAINTISYGEAQPEGDNATRDGRAANRRVVIRVLE
jgi:outer membrane protein OmpA-like peptidoglycan-associated protein